MLPEKEISCIPKKYNDLCQSEQSVQGDMVQNCLLRIHYLHVQRQFYIKTLPRIYETHCNRIHFLSPPSIVSIMVMWEGSMWLGKKVWKTGKKNSRKAWIGALASMI